MKLKELQEKVKWLSIKDLKKLAEFCNARANTLIEEDRKRAMGN